MRLPFLLTFALMGFSVAAAATVNAQAGGFWQLNLSEAGVAQQVA
ncbi:hypothetical protein [Deinococcus wulumuqiensis]|nr:hypothetical protein [Deinococcus wulumuqiensis]